MLDSPLASCIDVDLEGVAALKLDGAIAVADGGTSWICNTTWHPSTAVLRVCGHCIYESNFIALPEYGFHKHYLANMTSTTTTISETNSPSETIRLAAAYDDKTHEGVWLPMACLTTCRTTTDKEQSTNTQNTCRCMMRPQLFHQSNLSNSTTVAWTQTKRNPIC
jgi:hypothetical protein